MTKAVRTVRQPDGQDFDRGLTLREATTRFMDGALPEEVLSRCTEDHDAASRAMLAMRAFQEGAFWACWRLYREVLSDKPRLLDVMESILKEHAAVRDIAERVDDQRH